MRLSFRKTRKWQCSRLCRVDDVVASLREAISKLTGDCVACLVPTPALASGASVPARRALARNDMPNNMNFPTIFSITEDEIELNDLLAKITLTSTGAAAIFTGMVRGETSRGEAHETEYLEYEAYIPMAEAKMKQVADEIREKWPTVEGIAIVQRIGKLFPKTPTVLIACTAAHRDTGVFEAARYGIDRLKEIVPIWKKEVGLDGEVWVEGDYIPKAGE